MRLSLDEVENIAPAPFVLLTGLIGGVLQGVRELAHNSAPGALIAYLLGACGTVVLWWLSVRRRRHSVWSSAAQMALAVTLAQIVAFALVVPRVVPAQVHLRWHDVAVTVGSAQLALSPVRFIAAALFIAVGRLLPGSGRVQGSRNGAEPLSQHDAVI